MAPPVVSMKFDSFIGYLDPGIRIADSEGNVNHSGTMYVAADIMRAWAKQKFGSEQYPEVDVYFEHKISFYNFDHLIDFFKEFITLSDWYLMPLPSNDMYKAYRWCKDNVADGNWQITVISEVNTVCLKSQEDLVALKLFL